MPKTRKVQVTLAEEQYEALARIAHRQGKKLASVVRESIEQYCLAPETERAKRAALEALLALEPTPAPDEYAHWEREYAALKTKRDSA